MEGVAEYLPNGTNQVFINSNVVRCHCQESQYTQSLKLQFKFQPLEANKSVWNSIDHSNHSIGGASTLIARLCTIVSAWITGGLVSAQYNYCIASYNVEINRYNLQVLDLHVSSSQCISIYISAEISFLCVLIATKLEHHNNIKSTTLLLCK